MSIGLDDIGSINTLLMLQFGSVDKIKITNRTKPCSWVKTWSEYI